MTSNEAASSSRKRSGAASRCRRHQRSVAPICASAPGGVRTCRLTAADGARRESPKLAVADRLQRTVRMRRAPRAKRGAATRSITVPSRNVVGSFRTSHPFSTRARRGLMSGALCLPVNALGQLGRTAPQPPAVTYARQLPESSRSRGSSAGRADSTSYTCARTCMPPSRAG